MFVILEGLDCTGKSTVAELYKKRGFEIVHMSAPNKKYTEPGYTGPSYLDDLLELIMQYDGKDVVWDRSWYGETVWPHVYGRKPMLDEDDFEIFQEFEERNQTQRILMIDPDVNAHWQRIVARKEPLNQTQFKIASSLYSKLAHKYSFTPKELKDFDVKAETPKQAGPATKQQEPVQLAKSEAPIVSSVVASTGLSSASKTESDEDKLEKANAIKGVLDQQIFKRTKGNNRAIDLLEEDVKQYLRKQLSTILGTNTLDDFTNEEVQILKLYCKQLKERAGKK